MSDRSGRSLDPGVRQGDSHLDRKVLDKFYLCDIRDRESRPFSSPMVNADGIHGSRSCAERRPCRSSQHMNLAILVTSSKRMLFCCHRGPTQAEDGDSFALPCHFPAKAHSRENNFAARRCRKDDERTGKYQIGMCFLATDRIGSPAGFNFFPSFPCPAGKARGKARPIHAAVQDLCPPPGPAGREIGTCGEAAATVRRNFYCISGENPHSAALDSWVCPCWVCPSTRFWGSTCDALSSSGFWPPLCRRFGRCRPRGRPLPRSSRRSPPRF